jgi:hypothetical protein
MHECLYAVSLYLCCPAQAEADYQSEESYRPSVGFIISKLILIGDGPESLIRQGGKEEEEELTTLDAIHSELQENSSNKLLERR